MKTSLIVATLLIANSVSGLSLTDSSDQRLQKQADDATAYMSAISSGKKVKEPTEGTSVDSRDLNPDSPLFYAQEQDEILRGLKHSGQDHSTLSSQEKKRKAEADEEEFDYSESADGIAMTSSMRDVVSLQLDSELDTETMRPTSQYLIESYGLNYQQPLDLSQTASKLQISAVLKAQELSNMLLEKSKLVQEQSIDSKIKALKSDRQIAHLQQLEASQENTDLMQKLKQKQLFFMNESNNQKSESEELLKQSEEAKNTKLSGVGQDVVNQIQTNKQAYQSFIEKQEMAQTHHKKKHHHGHESKTKKWLAQGPVSKKQNSFWDFEI